MSDHLFVDLIEGDSNPAFAAVKLSFDLRGRRVEGPALRGAPGASIGALMPGNDFLISSRDEVVVNGEAYPSAPGGARGEVVCRVGAAVKRVAIFGHRTAAWTHAGDVKFSQPEPFEKLPMINANAYGGVDGRVPMPPPESLEELVTFLSAHPGIYPRNPAGKGYVVIDAALAGVPLPNLEDPDDLLTPARLIAGAPDRWWRQPLPWTLGARDLAMFPRLLPLGARVAHPPPEDDRLGEVRRGLLPVGFRSNPDRLTTDVLADEAAIGMSFVGLGPGTPVRVTGMTEDRAPLELGVPPRPSLRFELDGAVIPAEPCGSRISIDVNAGRIDVVLHARARLPRVFVPGIHKHIPLRFVADGVGSVEYVPPPTIHDARLAAGLVSGICT